jgi:uncharacterized membrane protein YgcG
LLSEEQINARVNPRQIERSHLDAVQGGGEARTEPYLNTVREYRSWQCSNAPKTAIKARLCRVWIAAVRVLYNVGGGMNGGGPGGGGAGAGGGTFDGGGDKGGGTGAPGAAVGKFKLGVVLS